MPGLNNLISNTSQQTTTLPNWYNTAQQNVATQAGNAFGVAPSPQNTVGQQAVNALSGPTNAFTQAGGTLQSIASGAANPWLTSASGAVTPNTQTALGGLFQAQNQQLNQLLPNATAPAEASAISSGNFGSLRGQTAVDKAKADALATLNAKQFQAALENQAIGVNAASGAGNVGQQNINNLLTTGQYQQASPFTNVSNYSKILGGLQVPTTVTNQTQLSPLNQIAGLVQVLGGQTGSGGILGALGVPGGLTGLIKKFIPSFGDDTQAAKNASGTAGINYGPTPSGGNIDQNGGIYGPTPSGSNIDRANVYPDIGGGAVPTDTSGGGYVDPISGESVGS
jgi:hypothetical protein